MSNSLDNGSGLIGWFVRNHVAANLLMMMILVGGGVTLWQTRKEVFPDFDIGIVTVRVPYLGASPAEVEDGVCIRVEEAILGVDGIKAIRSVATEGVGLVTAELEDYTVEATALNDIQQAVDRIDSFPLETEKPIVTLVASRVQVMSIVLYGDAPERTLKTLAEKVRDDLTSMRNVSQVDFAGIRRFELGIEVPEEQLRKYGLTFDEVAGAVRQSSLDLPGGSVKTEGGEVLIRTKGQRYVGREFEDIIVVSRPDGTELRLDKIGRVVDGYEDSDLETFFDGRAAAVVHVYRVGEQDAIEVAAAVKDYVADAQIDLPAGVSLQTWADRSVLLEGRINLLTRNAGIGLLLVFLSLSMFLEWKLAFWTMMGIPISFLGAFWILPYWDVTINMISLFAFIVVLGIVVDDAIVVGENIFAYRQKGMETHKAAVKGVMEMAAPVTFAIMTTVVAFLPLIYTKGMMGKMMKVIPLAVICVLLFSLVEALLILPAHLANPRPTGKAGALRRFQKGVNVILQWVIHKPYVWVLERAVAWRYVTLAGMGAVLVVTLSLIFAGKIKTSYLPQVDADNVVAEVELPRGAPVEQTRAVVRRLEEAAVRVRERLDAEWGGGEDSLIRHMNTTIGQQPFKALSQGRSQKGSTSSSSSHLAEVNLELLTSEERTYPSGTIANLWREEVGSIAGVSSLTFISTLITAGEAVSIEFSHRDFDKLLVGVEMLKERLGEFAGVYDINDSFLPGKRELSLSLKPEGRAMGLTLGMLAKQVRQGFYGEEAQRVQRDRDDIKVMVRYPEEERRSLSDIESMRVRLPSGEEAAFNTVAGVEIGRGFASINRTGRRRVVSVTADVDPDLANADEVNAALFETVLPELVRDMPGLSYSVKGAQEDRAESMSSLGNNFSMAILAIYVLLGVQFRSYIQPLIVMSAIPFGFVGAVVGHLIMGLELSFVSFFGCVALAGVVVNDALIMVDVLNKERAKGHGIGEVVLLSGVKRFRPIMLTTFTTFCGLTPMLLERSLQAKFLVPMAVSLAFGVLFATVITLVLAPVLYVIAEDVRGVFGWGDEAEVEPVESIAEAG